MSKFVRFPKINQLRHVIKSISMRERYVGHDSDGNAIYDNSMVLPKIEFHGTVKLHGTNSGIAVCGDEYWALSSSDIITPHSDNAGFASHWCGQYKKDAILQIVKSIRDNHNISDDLTVVLFGEWVGPTIQRNVAITQIPQKTMFLFAIRVVSTERDENGNYVYDNWLPINGIRNHEIGLYNVEDYKTFQLVINLNNPTAILHRIEEMVDEVERECPIAKEAFDVSGIGEGIVWTTDWNGKRTVFKTKGQKHSVTKNKKNKITSIDVEKMNSINEFVEYAVTVPRLEQGIEKVFRETGKVPSVKDTGTFIKWVVNDIIKEEIDTISENGLCSKDVNGGISKKSRDWFFQYLDKQLEIS